MPSRTRAQVAERVHEKLDRLAEDLTTAAMGAARPEGDYSFAIDSALSDCGFDDISEADSHAKIRAIERGTEHHILERLVGKWAARANAQQGAGASGMHLNVQWDEALRQLRYHSKQVKDQYEAALLAIGCSLDSDPAGSQPISGPVFVDDGDDATKALVDSTLDVGLPWYEEGYHEVGV